MVPSTYVSLGAVAGPPGELASIAMASSARDVESALEFGRSLGTVAKPPGAGSTRDLWEALATVACADLGFARAIEPHLDALAILQQAHEVGEPSEPDAAAATWGVFAAEGGDAPLTATTSSRGWTLDGTKPWCSLARHLDRALVTAHLPEGGRGLFDVDLRQGGIHLDSAAWYARGLSEIPSVPVVFAGASARLIGRPDWYLTREGFAWGGIGVAACWYGGAVGLARTLFGTVGDSPTPLAAMHLGAVDELLQSSRRALAEAAELVDTGAAVAGKVLAARVRATVARACEEVLTRCAHALGPAPLALDTTHAKRVADLELYIRQHHAEKDEASLGTTLAGAGQPPW